MRQMQYSISVEYTPCPPEKAAGYWAALALFYQLLEPNKLQEECKENGESDI